MNILIAYYSMTGHTQKVCQLLAEMLGADLERIEALKESGLAVKGMKAAFNMKSDIKPCRTDMDDIDFMVVATPVWAGHFTPYINKYLSILSNCRDTPFSVLAEMNKSGGDKAIEQVRKSLEKKGMQFVSSAVTIEEDVETYRFIDTVSKLSDSIKKYING